MNECTRRYFILNSNLKDISEFSDYFGDPEKYIYEVFRVQEAIPVFIEDHLDRLWHTALISDVELPFSRNDILKEIYMLIKANPPGDGNIKIFITLPNHGEMLRLLYFTPHQYPTKEQFTKGVAVRLFNAERNEPNAKIMDVALRSATDHIKTERNVYEVLLVSGQGFITEGSRSNVFFIQNQKLVTPPVHTVLEGVTRKNIIQLCKENNIEFTEEPVHINELNKMDAVFISGTSRRVLPVCCIDNLNFNPQHPLIPMLQQLFEDRVMQYLSRKKEGSEY
ncbi:MAG: aminotransferase class IV [Bacteroidales bacterium]